MDSTISDKVSLGVDEKAARRIHRWGERVIGFVEKRPGLWMLTWAPQPRKGRKVAAKPLNGKCCFRNPKELDELIKDPLTPLHGKERTDADNLYKDFKKWYEGQKPKG